MGGAALTDGRTGNGVFLASLDHFESESRTPTGQGAGCLMLARFSCVTLLACYFPRLKAKAAFFGRCLELACQHHTPRPPFSLAVSPRRMAPVRRFQTFPPRRGTGRFGPEAA